MHLVSRYMKSTFTKSASQMYKIVMLFKGNANRIYRNCLWNPELTIYFVIELTI